MVCLFSACIATPGGGGAVLSVVSEFPPRRMGDAKLIFHAAAERVGFADVIVVALLKTMLPPTVVKLAPRLMPPPAEKLKELALPDVIPALMLIGPAVAISE